MSLDHSVSRWISSLKEGDRSAARELWKRYFNRLAELARGYLSQNARRVSDEEDIALGCFRRLCLGAERQQFDQLTDRDDLWSLLATMARRRVIDLHRHQTSQKRGGVLENIELSSLVNAEPTPDAMAMMAEEHERLLSRLPEDSLRFIAEKKMEGATNEELASMLKLTPRSIERKLARIRECWESEILA